MSGPSVETRLLRTRRPLRVGALALAALMLVTACATGAPRGGGLTAPGHGSPETWAPESQAGDGNQGEAFFTRLPTDFAPVQVSDAEFSAALATLWLDTPLRLATPRPPLPVGRRLALASVSSSGEAWQSDMARSYGRHCERCGTPDHQVTTDGETVAWHPVL